VAQVPSGSERSHLLRQLLLTITSHSFSLRPSFLWLRCRLHTLSRTSHPSGSRQDTEALPPLATRWPQKTVGTQACPYEGITDLVVAMWLQPLLGSRLRQLRNPHWFREETQRAGGCPIRSRGSPNPNSSSAVLPNRHAVCTVNALLSSNGT
jgi:hypothetical protein